MVFRDEEGNKYVASWMYDSIYRHTLEKMVTRRLKVMPLPKKEIVDVGKSEPDSPGSVDREDVRSDSQHSEGDPERVSVGVHHDQPARTEDSDTEQQP